jgi:hypothetical protein
MKKLEMAEEIPHKNINSMTPHESEVTKRRENLNDEKTLELLEESTRSPCSRGELERFFCHDH